MLRQRNVAALGQRTQPNPRWTTSKLPEIRRLSKEDCFYWELTYPLHTLILMPPYIVQNISHIMLRIIVILRLYWFLKVTAVNENKGPTIVVHGVVFMSTRP